MASLCGGQDDTKHQPNERGDLERINSPEPVFDEEGENQSADYEDGKKDDDANLVVPVCEFYGRGPGAY
jgi:hypothetical protein